MVNHFDRTMRSERDHLLLKALIFGAFYPNYLRSVYENPDAVETIERQIQSTGEANFPYDVLRSVQLYKYTESVLYLIGSRLPEQANETHIKNSALSECGKISQVHIEWPRAYVQFESIQDAKLALKLGQRRLPLRGVEDS